MKKFDLMTSLGLILGIFLLAQATSDGGELTLFINLPSIFITVGGSFAAMLINYSFAQIKGAWKVTVNAFSAQLWDPHELVEKFTTMAGKARREGLLALDNELEHVKDPFFRKAVQLVVDGIDPDVVRNILETEIDCVSERHKMGQNFLLTWGQFAPAFGMVGTLIGLVQMLANLDDPSSIGPAMAIALLTTLYGALLANLVLLPLAGKLALRSKEELFYKQVIVEGMLAIQAGTNPRLIEEKIKAFMAPANGRKERQSAPEEVTVDAS